MATRVRVFFFDSELGWVENERAELDWSLVFEGRCPEHVAEHLEPIPSPFGEPVWSRCPLHPEWRYVTGDGMVLALDWRKVSNPPSPKAARLLFDMPLQ